MKQRQALRVLMDGGPVFLTGAPGAGKSYVLGQFVKLAERKGKRVAVTASTGIAATHIGGTTVHSWSGLGVREKLLGHDIDKMKANARLSKRYNATDILVIDEVSMLPGRMLDMLSTLCKALRDDDRPFGGLQVVLVGDMFQLPPINRESDVLDFAHKTAAWKELNPQICYITEQHRQSNDGLLEVLQAMRNAALTDDHKRLLAIRLRQHPTEEQNITRLYAHNADVDTINQRHLDALDGELQTYTMFASGRASKAEQLKRGVLAPEVLELKVGAEVMFVANDFAKGFANGSRGRVVRFYDGWPMVELTSGRTIVVEPHTWQLAEDGKIRAEVAQVPLRLAWAITIHKSQGMSLDAAEIDLSRSFTPGMGYVALSRVRSLDGIFLRGVNRMALQLHPDIFELDRMLYEASAALAAITEEYAEEAEPTETAEEAIDRALDQALLKRLYDWRRETAEKINMPPYIVAHNTLLEEIAHYKPCTEQKLLSVKGMGKAKLAAYGEELLKIVRDHTGATPEDIATEAAAEAEAPEPAAKPTSEIKAKYPRHGTRWRPDDDAQLVELFRGGMSLGKTSEILQRTPDSVWSRLAQNLNKEEGK